jgi:NAD(P)-dependent dehydrogenase (short-subunit alcohol dehydrogenase family)
MNEHTSIEQVDTTAIVVGASRGLGHGIATALADAGAHVVAVARSAGTYPRATPTVGTIDVEIADAADAAVPARIIDRYHPQLIVLVAGATPHMRPLQQQTWDTFSVNWHTDVRMTFHWLREALLTPLQPGSRVVVISSGVAVNPNGSPLSGGYAGSKTTQRLIAGYAQEEANRGRLDLTFTTLLPRFAPMTGVGRSAVAAYAARAGQSADDYVEEIGQLGAGVTPEIAGTAVLELVRADPASVAREYMLTGVGLQPLS